jgi:hypothetical protein
VESRTIQEYNARREGQVGKRNKKKTGNELPYPPMEDTPGWLRRFLFGLAAIYLGLVVLFLGYDIWSGLAVIGPAEEALSSAPPDHAAAWERLEHPHFFSGYEAWHDFGTDNAQKQASRIDIMLAADRPYTDREIQDLKHHASYWIPAFKKHKLEGSVSIQAGDIAVLESLLERWQNARTVTRKFMVYLLLISMITGGLYLLYRRFKLWDRIGPIDS